VPIEEAAPISARCSPSRIDVNCDPASLWHRSPVSWVPRDQRAISIASRTIVVRMCEATHHPTIVREKASMMKQT